MNIVYNMRMGSSRFLLVVFLIALCLALTRCGQDWCVAGLGPCKNIPSFDPDTASGGGGTSYSVSSSPQTISVTATDKTSTLTVSGGTSPYTWTIDSTVADLGTLSSATTTGTTNTYTAPTTVPGSVNPIPIKVKDSSNPVNSTLAFIYLQP